MRIDRTPVAVMLLLAVVAAAQFRHYYPQLPETIAVHFGRSGQANGWCGRACFFILYGAIEGVVALGGIASAFLRERMPTSFLNIPNKDHWLSPERHEESLVFFWTQTLWIEVMTLAFLIGIAELVFRANLAAGPPSLPGQFPLILIVFAAGVVWQSVRIVRRFSRPGT